MKLVVIHESGPKHKTLESNVVDLDDAKRAEVMRHKAVWHKGPAGTVTPAIRKSVVRGRTYYWSATHRCFQSAGTLAAAINDYFETVKPSA